MAPPPVLLLPRWLLVVGGVTSAAKPRSFSNYSLPGIGLGSSNSSSTRSRSSRRFSSNAEQSTGSRRRWWSDEAQFDDNDEEEFEENEEEGFSFGGGSASWSQAFDEPWFTKASRAYGYVLPVVLVSMLAASGPQAFLMAMAIPLAQSAVSLAIRAFSNTSSWGRRNQEEYDDDYYSDYRSSGWEEPEQEEYSNTSSAKYKDSSRSRSQQQQPWAKGGKSEDAEPTVGSDNTDSASSSNNTDKSGSSAGFGGWDELDAGNDVQYRSSGSSRRSAGASPAADKASAAATGGGGGAARSMRRRRPQPERRRPRSRAAAAARYRQSPLFMRLLVALFPFLGSWFRIML
nr:stress protein DDR48-like [Lolium perenne]